MQKSLVTLEGRIIALCVRRHRRARRISLRLSAAHDAVIMTLPPRASVDSGMEFFISKKRWVLENIALEPPVTLTHGAPLTILGKEVTVVHVQGRGVTAFAEDTVRVHGAAEFTARRLKDFLKKLLREECLTRATLAAQKIGKPVRGVTVRDTSSRWGSCSKSGNLTFSWRLVFAPSHVLDYLIAHEVAHLVEMNHGPRFWDVVARLYPEYKTTRRWLREHGHALHRYGGDV